jgi:hypothetical protein
MRTAFFILATLFFTTGFLSQANAASAANGLNLFHQMIDVQRDSSGQITQIILKAPANSSSHVAQFLAGLSTGIAQPNRKATISAQELQSLALQGWSQEQIQNLADAKAKLASSSKKLQKILSNNEVTNILEKLEKALNGIMALNVLAVPGNPKYFQDHSLLNNAIQQAIDLAGNAPDVKAVEFLINEVVNLVTFKQSFYQNALLAYMQNFEASDLGLSADEVSLIRSSIYDSRLSWDDIFGQSDAQGNWSTFGNNKFASSVSDDQDRLNQYAGDYSQVGSSYCFAFAPASKGGVTYILNTRDHQNEISDDLSIAFDSSHPTQIQNQRMELELVELASTLLPAPGFVIDQLDDLISSYFKPQSQTEGALYAYLSSQGMDTEAQTILAQTNNPFLTDEAAQ